MSAPIYDYGHHIRCHKYKPEDTRLNSCDCHTWAKMGTPTKTKEEDPKNFTAMFAKLNKKPWEDIEVKKEPEWP